MKCLREDTFPSSGNTWKIFALNDMLVCALQSTEMAHLHLGPLAPVACKRVSLDTSSGID